VRAKDERGELGLRLIIVMAVIAGLAWAIPMVFLGHAEVDNAATLVGATGSGGHGGAGATGAPEAPIAKANDVQAQASLNDAITVAQMYFAENGSYDGFTAQEAAAQEPVLHFTSGIASPGVVSIRGVTPTTVVLVTTTTNGGYLCAAADSSTVSFGRANAQSPAQCTGGW
jgi:hypothetical protein